METIILCTIFGVFILLAYTLGLSNGQKLSKEEQITLPDINPVKIVEDIKEKKEATEYEKSVLNDLQMIDEFSVSMGKNQEE